ncbi:Phosphatidylinositol 4-phosphate 5-kinase its3 [Choanephora cucurbitarum]|uniref:1-phosphatidylinositol-4-phosphate 5-kinase n=1 Tax=Choanephora cucurbitarum TaxID=101091 RepID=A0A1C7NBH7_9FUNG|nr:Phosphatidylinositol 4-phosphate 5-kinase its3 [Choanephora cucurbitarum]
MSAVLVPAPCSPPSLLSSPSSDNQNPQTLACSPIEIPSLITTRSSLLDNSSEPTSMTPTSTRRDLSEYVPQESKLGPVRLETGHDIDSHDLRSNAHSNHAPTSSEFMWTNSVNKNEPTLLPLEKTQSCPSPAAPLSVRQRTTSSRSDNNHQNIHQSKRRHTVAPDLGDLDPEEQAVLEAEITARRQARRASRRQMSVSENEAEYEPEEYQHAMPHHDYDDERVVIGTRVAEGHRNYQLMYDMLTGIRIAVGRVSAKIRRELVDDDFTAAHKLVFDVTGNELTPGVKYDFKFKDYAPWVFRYLREQFHIDPADYMMSLTNKYILSELGSPGKSGSFFYYSRDYRFIIKTIHHTEHKFMRKVLKAYYQHVCANPNTLLCRFYGLHRIKLPHGRKIHFVVMGNVFPTNKDVHETYDLKGSTFGRVTNEEEIAKNPHAVLKDLNWVQREKRLELGKIKRSLLLDQLHRDVELLAKLDIMDYSLLIGIHDYIRGNKEGIRDNRLQVISPHTKGRERSLSTRGRRESRADIVRKAIKFANPVQLDSSQLPEQPSDERKYCIFYSEDGGFKSTDEFDDSTDKVYFLGVIDILTPYNFLKRLEHFYKSLTQNKDTISAVKPEAYGKRFIRFIEDTVTSNLKKQQ